MKQRLYLQLYFAMLGATLLCVVAVALLFRVLGEPGGPPAERLRVAAGVVEQALTGVPDAELHARLPGLADEVSLDLAVFDARGVEIVRSSRRPLAPPPGVGRAWRHEPFGLERFVPIDAGRVVAMRSRHRGPRPPIPLVFGLALLAVVMAVGSYPVARRLTRRLETLAGGVARWGAGDLAHRVSVEGKDEVAMLAATFNRAAEQVDKLVAQQRETLASASHELRSPLARLELALALIAEADSEQKRGELIENARKDIVDLDALIEDLLLMARADGKTPRRPFERVALRALLAAEAARVGAEVEGPELELEGDPLLLRHLARNLLENAQRYGRGQPIRALIEPGERAVTLAVEDRGPGIPEAERERIFAPFYRAPGADQAASGTGLGLSLVRQVARYHGGEARVLPRSGGGSRFEVTLPAAGSGASAS